MGLLCVFWIFFGRKDIARYAAHRLLVTTSSTGPEPAGLAAPGVTVCGRSAGSGVGWRGINTDPGGFGEISSCCGDSQNTFKPPKTFNFTEVVSLAVLGYNNPKIDLDVWVADFTWVSEGMCYTLNYNKTMTEDVGKHMMMIYSNNSDSVYNLYSRP